MFWGYIKDRVYVPSLPTTLEEVRRCITVAVNSMDRDTVNICNDVPINLITFSLLIEYWEIEAYSRKTAIAFRLSIGVTKLC